MVVGSNAQDETEFGLSFIFFRAMRVHLAACERLASFQSDGVGWRLISARSSRNGSMGISSMAFDLDSKH